MALLGATGNGIYLWALRGLEEFREAVTTLEEIEPIARRVFGGAHPTALAIEGTLRIARGMLAAYPSIAREDK